MATDAFHYELEPDGSSRLRIVLHGEPEASGLSALNRELQSLLAPWPSGAAVIVDLTDVPRCDPAACRSLARVQRTLAAHGCRTAWLATRPRLRGAAWWIVHAAGDPLAMPVTSPRFAEDWLRDQGRRLDRIEGHMHDALRRSDPGVTRDGGRR